MKRELLQFRTISAPVLREAVEGGAGVTIEGMGIVYGVESEPLYEWGYDRERIEPGAVTPELLARSDIKMTLWHNRERLLARWNAGQGTLQLEARPEGLWYSFEVPNTPDGQTALELVRRGDLAGASFTYWSSERNSVDYEDTADGILRRVRKIDALYEVTLASDPAYQATTAEARELREVLAEHIEARKDAEAEAKARELRKREEKLAALRRAVAWKRF